MDNLTDREKTKLIQNALHDRFSDASRYIFATEVSTSTGFSPRRIDACVLRCYASEDFALEGFEIKVSKSDMMNELHDAHKHIAFYNMFDYFNLVIPDDLLSEAIKLIPEKWGVYYYKNDKLRCKRKPICLHDEINTSVDKSFMASFMRRAAFAAATPAKALLDAAREQGYADAKYEFRMSKDKRKYQHLESENLYMKEILGTLADMHHIEVKKLVKLLENVDPGDLVHMLEQVRQLQQVIKDIQIPSLDVSILSDIFKNAKSSEELLAEVAEQKS